MKKLVPLFLAFVTTISMFSQSRLEIAKQYSDSHPVAKSVGPFENCYDAEPINSSAPIVVPFVNGFDEFEFLGGSCLSTNEHQVRWFQFSFSSAGTFEFMCTPDLLGADYDFALWKGNCPSGLCGTAPAEVVACDYSGPINNPPFVPTGISSDPNATFGVPGITEFEPTITVETNINYYLLLDNITANGLGFSLEFAGTATIATPIFSPQYILSDTLCSNAPFVECSCLETGISISTGEPNASIAPPNFCGSVENQQWIKFEACWCTIDMIIENTACDNNSGVEAQLFSSCAPNFTPKSNCTFIPVGTTGGFSNINCTPGEFIYLMIDGISGDMCDVNVTVEEGPTSPVVISQDTIFGQTTACEGDTVVYFSPPVFNAAHCDFTYFGNGSTSDPSHDSVVVVLGAGMGTLCFEATNCTSSQTVCIDVNVLPNEHVITDTINICSNDLPYTYGNATINFSGVFEYDTLQSAFGCDSILQVEAIIYDSVQCSINVIGELTSPNGVVLQNIVSYPFGLYSYQWSGPGIIISNQNDFEQTVYVPGQYELMVTDVLSGCTASSSIFLSAIDTCATFNYPIAPADSCQNAPPFCADYLNGYCSINDGYSANIPGNLNSAFDCTIENNQWLSFMACDETVTFVFSIGDCNVGTGLEFGVFQTNDCLDYLALATCLSIDSGVTDTLRVDNLVPGGQYLLMVDGISGSVCRWQVTGLQGASGEAYIQENITPGHINGESSICLGLDDPPSDEFTYTVEPPICTYNPSDNNCMGDSATCQPAKQQFCEPHLDTLYKPTAYDTIWYISPHTAGHFVNDDSVGASVDVVWDSIGTFYLGANIVAVEWDTVAFWNDCIGLCTIVCGDPEGDDCVIKPLKVTIDNSDVFDLFFEKCPEECIIANVPNPVELCSPGFYVFGNPDNCEDLYNVTVIDFEPQNTNTEITVCQGECTFFMGQPYCSGFYEIPYIDINGCNAIMFLEVIEEPVPAVIITGEDEINCLNPEATLTANSNSPFQINFNWSNGTNGPVVIVNTGGLYTVTVTDFNGCTGETSFFVSENFQNEEEDLGEIILCPGECFELNGNMYCNAGNYSEDFIDPVSGCINTYLFTILIDTQLPMQIGAVSEICDGINEYYTVEFNILNGVPPFIINGEIINGNFFQSDPIPTGDPYYFNVSDNYNCGINQQIVQGFFECPCITDAGSMELFVLNQCEDEMVTPDFNNNQILDPNDILVFILHDNSGNSLGNIFGINATGTFGFVPGMMQYGVTYYISPVAGNEANGAVDMASACLNVGQGQPVIFYQTPEVEIIPPQSLNCINPSTEIITNVLQEGSGQLSYSWSGPGGFQSVEANPVVDDGGDYTLTIFDNVSGCETAASVYIGEDFEEPILDLSSSGVIDCNNTLATLQVTSQQSNSSYQWTTPSGNLLMGEIITVHEAGDYTVLATAANGCTSESSIVQYEDLAAPFIQASDGLITCSDPIATLSGFSGEPNIQFQWVMPDGDTLGGIAITTTNIGNYTLIATGINGCTSEEIVLVEADTVQPDLQVQSGEITCAEPSITLEATTSTTGAVINWIFPTGNEVNGETVTTNLPGDYIVVSTSPNGCTTALQTSVTSNEEIPIFTLNTGAIDCLQTFDTLVANSSVTDLIYNWQLPGGGQATGDTLIAGQPGQYVVNASSSNGCTAEMTTIIVDNTHPPDMDFSFGEINCLQSATILNATSNMAGSTFLWLFPNGNTVNGSSVTSTTVGNYSLVVTAPNGCSVEETFEVLDNTTPPLFDLIGEDISCSDPSATLIALSNNSNLFFQWTMPNDSIFSGSILETIMAGNYEVTATSSNGCTSQQSWMVNEIDTESLTLELAISDPTCFGVDDGFIIIGDVIGVNGDWSSTINGENLSTSEYLDLSAGEYELMIVDTNGCFGSTTVQLTSPPEVIVSLGDDLFVHKNEQIELGFQSSINPTNISWSGPNGSVWEGVENLSILAIENGIYSITISDANGCEDSDELAIYVSGQSQVYIPNVFSPNGDLQNDYLTVFAGDEVEQVISFKVFNRWGGLVFSRENFEPNKPMIGWDGTFKNKKLNSEVFAYIAEIASKTGETIIVTGDVLLLK